ncbi:MarR family winged helix-turn-helix transcriptional regulator [Janibacter corallicola]|uniref:MarR family winged helix-turn-helix transcriptional regulator n=1 Tax=Janibacter corallicola TaxID=415212 RepID=UPI00083425DE|nr:MarR family winged helix-turn-helix transcriptional regulator [Janibacter corallicola]
MTGTRSEVRRAETPDQLGNAPGFVIRRLYQSYTALWSRMIGSQLTGPQFAVLDVLDAYDGSDQVSVGHAAALDASTMVDVARRLERRSLIVRTRSPIDARRKVVQITSLGESELARARERRVELEGILFGHNRRRKDEIMAEMNDLSKRWVELASELAAADD